LPHLSAHDVAEIDGEVRAKLRSAHFNSVTLIARRFL
jgi:hypothetical protein